MSIKTICAISDSHAGHENGLISPNMAVERIDQNGNIVPYYFHMSEINKHIWNLHQRIVARAKAADYLILIHLGDIVQGTKYVDGVLTTNLAEQIEIAYGNFMEFYNLPNLKAVRIITGTRSHEDGVGTASKILGARLRREFPNVDTKTVEHSLLDVEGIIVDAAHHGPSAGTRTWLQGNEARYYLRSLLMAEIMAGKRPPDLVMRGHYHVKISETLDINGREHRLVIMPSMMMMDTGFTRQATRSSYTVTNGGVFVEVFNGMMFPPTFITESVDVRTKESI